MDKWAYRSSLLELEPMASTEDARRAVIAEAIAQGHEPIPETAHAESVMPGLWRDVVRRWHGVPGTSSWRSEVVDLDPRQVREGGLLMRWRHSVAYECVASTWRGYVQVKADDERSHHARVLVQEHEERHGVITGAEMSALAIEENDLPTEQVLGWWDEAASARPQGHVRLSLRLPVELVDRLADRALLAGTSTRELARQLLEQGLSAPQ